MDNKIYNTGFFGFKSRLASKLNKKLFSKLKCTTVKRSGSTFKGDYKVEYSRLDPSVTEVFRECGLLHVSKGINETDFSSTSRLEPNENFKDVLVFTYDDKMTRGWVFIEDQGIYEIWAGEYPWRQIQEVDIVFSFEDEKHEHLSIASLK